MQQVTIGSAAFRSFLSFAWRPENDGRDEDRAEGETFNTRWGVIDATWEGAQNAGVVPNDVELVDATIDQLATVLKWESWDRVRGDALTAVGFGPVAIMLGDMAMVAGAGGAAKALQRCINRELGDGTVVVDGAFGPATYAATLKLCAKGMPHAVAALAQADDEYYASCRQASRFLHGWERRVADCEKFSLDIAHTTQVA